MSREIGTKQTGYTVIEFTNTHLALIPHKVTTIIY